MCGESRDIPACVWHSTHVASDFHVRCGQICLKLLNFVIFLLLIYYRLVAAHGYDHIHVVIVLLTQACIQVCMHASKVSLLTQGPHFLAFLFVMYLSARVQPTALGSAHAKGCETISAQVCIFVQVWCTGDSKCCTYTDCTATWHLHYMFTNA